MFTFFCSTCEAKLVVKDEELIGKILACPKCGSMVLVQSPDDAPTPPHNSSPKPSVHRKFPEALTHETASGIIGYLPERNIRADVLLDTVSSESDVSEMEIKARKVLIGILIGLSIFLLVALGFLMLFRKPVSSPPPEPQKPVFQIPVEPLPNPPIKPAPEPAVAVSAEGEGVDVLLPSEELLETPPQNMATEPELFHDEQIETTGDTLSAFENKMPGLVETSVPNIDIAEKLGLPILELNLNQQRLIEFVRVVSRLTGIPMTLDIDEMRPISVSVETPVAGQFSETTAGTILTETLATLGLQWVIADRQILILPKKTTDETDLTFDVSDFAEKTDDLNPEILADMIQRLVCPEKNITFLPEGRLTIAHDEKNQKPNRKSQNRQREDIRRFLEQLRAIRHLPQKTELIGETLAPEAFGWDRVMEVVTLNYYRPVPLSRIVAQLESATKLSILIDHQSFHRSLCPFASIPATIQCDQGTVNDAMELLLASVDSVALAYRIIDPQTLEITTMESARQPDKMTVEVHPYQLRKDETPEDIVRSLRSAVEPESWVISELPETKYGGNIIIDRPSNCLLIRQSQPAQRQIRLYLSTLEP